MKTLKRLSIFIFAFAALVSSGCAIQNAADFTDPGVCAYVNGTPVYELQIQQYKDVSKLYWQAVADLGDKPAIGAGADNPEALAWVFSLNYSKAQSCLAWSDSDWTHAFYKVLLINDDLYNHSKTDIEDIAALADATVNESLKTGKLHYIDGSLLDVFPMLDALSEKYGMSREDSANYILRAFLCSMGEEDTLMRYFAQNDYKGTPVIWDGTNTEECIAYLADLYEQYGAYLGGLLEKADIVEKS